MHFARAKYENCRSFSRARNDQPFPSTFFIYLAWWRPLVFRFGAETMKSLSPVAIASKANAPAPMYFAPRFFPIFQYVLFIWFQPLLSVLLPQIQRLWPQNVAANNESAINDFPVTDQSMFVKTVQCLFAFNTIADIYCFLSLRDRFAWYLETLISRPFVNSWNQGTNIMCLEMYMHM